MRRDRELFPGDVMFADVPLELVQIPNPVETDVEARAMAAQLGPNATIAEIDELVAREVALGD